MTFDEEPSEPVAIRTVWRVDREQLTLVDMTNHLNNLRHLVWFNVYLEMFDDQLKEKYADEVTTKIVVRRAF